MGSLDCGRRAGDIGRLTMPVARWRARLRLSMRGPSAARTVVVFCRRRFVAAASRRTPALAAEIARQLDMRGSVEYRLATGTSLAGCAR